MPNSRQRHRIPHQRLARERPNHLSTNVRSQQKNLLRHHPRQVIRPHNILQLHAAIELLQLRQSLNPNLYRHVQGLVQIVSPSAIFAFTHSASSASAPSPSSPSRPPPARSI